MAAELFLENLESSSSTNNNHHLCQDHQCQVCGITLEAIAQNVENNILEDLDAAAQASGQQLEAELLATAFESYRRGKGTGATP